MTHAEMMEHYSLLHAQSIYGNTANDRQRAADAAEALGSVLSPGNSVLDCSAGRGHFVRQMSARGYVCTATEADEYLCTHDLAEFAPKHIAYADLPSLLPQQWDAVVSLDVLEHLLSEDEIREALGALAVLARRYLYISVGTTQSAWAGVGGRRVTLHHVVRPYAWWSAEVARLGQIVYERESSIAAFFLVRTEQCA
jgi:hypothetical protein